MESDQVTVNFINIYRILYLTNTTWNIRLDCYIKSSAWFNKIKQNCQNIQFFTLRMCSKFILWQVKCHSTFARGLSERGCGRHCAVTAMSLRCQYASRPWGRPAPRKPVDSLATSRNWVTHTNLQEIVSLFGILNQDWSIVQGTILFWHKDIVYLMLSLFSRLRKKGEGSQFYIFLFFLQNVYVN